MLGVGEMFPKFNLKAVDGIPFEDIDVNDAFIEVNNNSYKDKWLVVFFYPKDFTFICPTEIAAFSEMVESFEERNAQVLTGSTDSEFVHLAWRKHQEELNDVSFPMFSDVKRELTNTLGILDLNEGVSQRATYIVDPQGVIRHVSVNDINVGRNPSEILRILDALQTEELCQCNWNIGEQTISQLIAVK